MRNKEDVRREIMGERPRNALPRIKRQVMRICEALGVPYDDLAVLRVEAGQVMVTLYDRDPAGALYTTADGQPARVTRMFEVDTDTFLGDELDV